MPDFEIPPNWALISCEAYTTGNEDPETGISADQWGNIRQFSANSCDTDGLIATMICILKRKDDMAVMRHSIMPI